MNILFVNYGDFTTNSLNHIGGFANTLCASGHACVVAVPSGKDSIKAIAHPLFVAATYAEALENPGLFPDGRPAEVIHAWTPRESVRRFVLAYQRKVHARLVIHLEDNEDFLLASYLGEPIESVLTLSEELLAEKSMTGLSHPRRYRAFLGAADGVTVIVDALRAFVPAGVPILELPPGVDFTQYRPLEAKKVLRRELGIADHEKVIVFTGSNTFANEPEMRELYLAVSLLNQQGVPTRLIRTGFNTDRFKASLPAALTEAVIDLGFIDKSRLPDLLALSDVLVHPGKPGAFNDYRLPSKLPEFLSSGKAVILPALNVGQELKDGVDALILADASPAEMAKACLRLFADPALAQRLGEGSVAFARRRFDLAGNTAKLAAFYRQILAAPRRAGSTGELAGEETEITLAVRALAAAVKGTPASASAEALVPLVTDLERSDPSRAERQQLQRERDQLLKVSELTKQHASNLETAITAARESAALSGQHIQNLEGTLAESRKTVENTLNRIALATQRQGELERIIRERDERVAKQTDRLAHATAVIATREEKIARMQASFSWKVTAPLRALRRTFFPKPAAAASAGVTPDAEHGTAYTFHIGHPQAWTTRSARLLIMGWCFENDGRPITGIRVRFCGEVTEGVYGAKRPDVFAAHGQRKQAEACGFSLETPTLPGEQLLLLEVRHGDAWHAVFETTVHVGQAGDEADLSEYEAWARTHEALSAEDVAAIHRHIESLPRKVISIVMPTYNTPALYLEAAIESVRAQLYPHWQLCLADDASTQPHVRAVINQYTKLDSRIVAAFREKNGHICAASNTALGLVTGDYVALMDHDDLLAATALYEVAAEIEAHPQAQLLYSDEDKMDLEGHRFEPYFKPDWNPDLFVGQNYLSHLTVYCAAAVREVGGFRNGFEGSQDWDLALRVIETLPEGAIRHIPKILYHWRAIPGSTALVLSEKSYTVDAAYRALTEHFERLHQPVEILPVNGGHWRIRHPVPAEAPLVSLVIPTKNAVSLLRQAITSIVARTAYPNYEIVVVDNSSDDPATLAYFSELSGMTAPRARVVAYPGPFNYSAINNHAVREAAGDLVAFLNNDVEVINADWLNEMVAQALRPGVGAVGAMLYYPLDTVQHAGVVLGLGGVAGHPFKQFPRGNEGQMNRLRLVQNYSAVTAACLVVQKAHFLAVGGFDEEHLAIAFNDVDLCCKLLRAGLRNVWTPYAEFYHHESASRGAEDTPAKQARFKQEIDYMTATWGELLQNDPAYNPNLTLVGEDFTRAYLPRTRKPWLAHRARLSLASA